LIAARLPAAASACADDDVRPPAAGRPVAEAPGRAEVRDVVGRVALWRTGPRVAPSDPLVLLKVGRPGRPPFASPAELTLSLSSDGQEGVGAAPAVDDRAPRPSEE